MSWQWVIVVVIEVLAVAFLLWRMWPGAHRPKRLEKPDVKTGSLLKKHRRSEPGDCH